MNNEVKDKIKLLTEAYAKQLPAKVKEIDILWREVKKTADHEKIKKLISDAHTLCGTSGTYGYTLISELARHLENNFYLIQSADGLQKVEAEIDNAVQDLQQLALSQPEQDIDLSLNTTVIDSNKARTIYVLTKDTIAYENIQQYNYVVKIYASVPDFFQAVNSLHPDMIIIDVDYIEEMPFENIKKLRDDLVLVVYVSDHDELVTRLTAIRHGGQAFLVKPFEITDLIHTMDDLFEAKKMLNERILIVDDSVFLATYYSMILETFGLICEEVTDPKNFLSALQEFQPDLILMDINMPFCTGSELAQVVNQKENLSGIPIIFLSTISEKSKQLEVLSYAGDDFLTKPVFPKHLFASIRNRLMRSRMIRSRMMRDGLTNLYNHTMIHHLLDREISIANRYHRELQVVLLDIDHFKLVNDTYGHQVGDQILKEMSVFLQAHLRKSDLLGRYGGEEFLIILPNTSRDHAFKIVDNLREKFANKPHWIGDKQLFVTLSGGIASYPEADDISKLIKNADNALYNAKNEGRNRIIG